jgi:dTDP-4-dehydrorhamnose reductase
VADGQLRLKTADGRLKLSLLERVDGVTGKSRNATGRRILLLGKNGQVGWELERTLAPLGAVKAVDFPEVDLADADGVRRLVREARPDVIVNAAAYTDVDRAESEPDLAMAVNGTAPGVLAEEAKALRALLIHYSTDYVFDGTKGAPYTEEDVPNPINCYGRSKLEGECAIQTVGSAYLILRTSWVYSLRGNSFVTKVLRWAREKEVLRIVEDQVGSPTWARMLAEVTAQILAKARAPICHWGYAHRGIYHVAGEGAVSRYAWAQAILQFDPRPEEQMARKVQVARSGEFPVQVQRPLFSALDCSLFREVFHLSPPLWHESLRLAMGNWHLSAT